MTLNHFPQLLNGYNCDVAVNHRVAVRANRTQIGNRVNLILSANLEQCFEMVDVNKAAAKLAIHSLEIEAANRTSATVVLNALLACLRTLRQNLRMLFPSICYFKRFFNLSCSWRGFVP